MTHPSDSADRYPDLTPEIDRLRYQRGAEVLSAVVSRPGEKREVIDLSDVAPQLGELVAAFGFGDVYARPGLVPQQRQLVTISILTALGGCEPQLEVHLGGALNVGVTPVEIVEAITQAAVYCGFPKALNAMYVVKKVFNARGLVPVYPKQAE